MPSKRLRNYFTSVMVDGVLDKWSGSNQQHDKDANKKALERAEFLRCHGHTAYAVKVIQILPEDITGEKEGPLDKDI